METSAFNIQVPETIVHTAYLQSEPEFSCRSGRRLVGCLPLSSRAGYRASRGKGSKGTGTGAWGCEKQVGWRSNGREEGQGGGRGKTTVCLEKLMGNQKADGKRDLRG